MPAFFTGSGNPEKLLYMKKYFWPALVLVSIVSFLIRCKAPAGSLTGTTQLPADNSRNSLDWEGVYRGVLPCADCEGITTMISLSKNQTYRLTMTHTGNEGRNTTYSGKFSWNDQGNIITLENAGTMPANYLVGENRLIQLDRSGNQITGALAGKYILSKSAREITERYWKLTELYGKPVPADSNFATEPFIIFKEREGSYSGFGGCNRITGLYQLPEAGRIRITTGSATLMACRNLEWEKSFLKALATADNFTILGDQLVLNKAKMSVLARFKSVALK